MHIFRANSRIILLFVSFIQFCSFVATYVPAPRFCSSFWNLSYCPPSCPTGFHCFQPLRIAYAENVHILKSNITLSLNYKRWIKPLHLNGCSCGVTITKGATLVFTSVASYSSSVYFYLGISSMMRYLGIWQGVRWVAKSWSSRYLKIIGGLACIVEWSRVIISIYTWPPSEVLVQGSK